MFQVEISDASSSVTAIRTLEQDLPHKAAYAHGSLLFKGSRVHTCGPISRCPANGLPTKKKEIEKYFDKKKKKLGAHYYPAVATYGISTHTHKKRGRDDL